MEASVLNKARSSLFVIGNTIFHLNPAHAFRAEPEELVDACGFLVNYPSYAVAVMKKDPKITFTQAIQEAYTYTSGASGEPMRSVPQENIAEMVRKDGYYVSEFEEDEPLPPVAVYSTTTYGEMRIYQYGLTILIPADGSPATLHRFD